jgi:hypothetical protein
MTLTAQSWVVIQTLLMKSPYELAAPILAVLNKEFDTAIAGAGVAARGNGETHAGGASPL